MEGRPPDLKSKISQEDNGEQRSSLNHIHDRAQGQLVQHTVATQAAIAPKALAVVHGNEALDYGRLSARANQIARFLNSQGICAESLVAVCIERSLSMVIANLGVLTSGAAYLPLDPSYPNERLNFMLNDARPKVLLTQHHLAKRLPLGDWHTIIVSPDAPEFSRQSNEWMDGGAKSHNLAYVIYTSGSTGLPKGVQITHANLSNLVNWHHEAFNICPADRALHFSSPSFDAAVWELWPYLAMGASVHLAEDDFRNSPSALRDWITKEKLTIGFVPTPIAEHMISLEWSPKTSLRFLLTGADTLRKYPRQG